MLQLDCLDITAISAAEYSCLYAAASQQRQLRAERYTRREEALRCIAADALLRRAMRRCGVALDSPVLQSEHGKPYVEHPWFHFNLSHAGRWVVIAYADRPVGVDVEQILDGEMRHKLARRYFSSLEQSEVLCDDDPRGIAERFAAVWTGKESYVKFLGCGLRVPLDSFSVHIKEGYVSDASGVRCTPRLHFASLDAQHLVCACAEADACRLSVLQLADLMDA